MSLQKIVGKSLLDSSRKRNALELTVVAERYADSGDVVGAIHKYREALSIFNDAASWHARLARLSLSIDNHREAMEAITVALSLSEDTPAGWYWLKGLALVGLEKSEDALTAFEKAIAIDDSNASWVARVDRLKAVNAHKKALSFFEDGDLMAAREHLQSALSLESGVASWHVLAAKLHIRLNENEAATEEIGRAIALTKEVPANWFALKGQTLAKCDRGDEAIIELCSAIDADPGVASWHALLGRLQQRSGELSQAAASYETATRLDRRHSIWQAELDDIRKRISQGGGKANSNERDAGWYDTVYKDSDHYSEHYSETIYFNVWKRIIEIVLATGCSDILEIGCGSGQLAHALSDSAPDLKYRGFDFSASAIEIARRACPKCEFTVGDARDPTLYDSAFNGLVISTEVLEHIEQDLEVVQTIPVGVRFVGTVPDFDSYTHVRYFTNEAEVEERYGRYLNEFWIEKHSLGAGNLFLFGGVTRPVENI